MKFFLTARQGAALSLGFESKRLHERFAALDFLALGLGHATIAYSSPASSAPASLIEQAIAVTVRLLGNRRRFSTGSAKSASEDQPPAYLRKQWEEIAARNEADSKAYQSEKMLREYGDKIDAADKAAVERAVEKLKDALKGENIDKIKSASAELDAAAQKVGEKMYAQAGQSAGPGPGGAQPGAGQSAKSGNDDVVDAEYEKVD